MGIPGKRGTNEQFIKDARKVHGNRYDYSMVEYVNAKTNVMITCTIHGDFPQTPASHINGHDGCRKCRGLETWTKELVLEEALKYKYRGEREREETNNSPLARCALPGRYCWYCHKLPINS